MYCFKVQPEQCFEYISLFQIRQCRGIYFVKRPIWLSFSSNFTGVGPRLAASKMQPLNYLRVFSLARMRGVADNLQILENTTVCIRLLGQDSPLARSPRNDYQSNIQRYVLRCC